MRFGAYQTSTCGLIIAVQNALAEELLEYFFNFIRGIPG
jgi:hypothetical protein